MPDSVSMLRSFVPLCSSLMTQASVWGKTANISHVSHTHRLAHKHRHTHSPELQLSCFCFDRSTSFCQKRRDRCWNAVAVALPLLRGYSLQFCFNFIFVFTYVCMYVPLFVHSCGVRSLTALFDAWRHSDVELTLILSFAVFSCVRVDLNS